MTTRRDSAPVLLPALELVARELERLDRKQRPVVPPDPAGFVDWAQSIRTAKGRRYDLERYAYQREVLQVMADPAVKRVVVMKAVQVGASEAMGRLHLGFALRDRITILHLFPTARHMGDFVDSRIRPLIRHNRQFADALGSPNNRGQIQLGRSYSFFRGAETLNDVISIDADLLIIDEFDLLDPENVQEAIRRIAASELALIRYAGVPTEPDFGIAELYAQSDQRQWHVGCRACSNAAPLTFEANVQCENIDGRIGEARLVCANCSAELDVRDGRWIPRHPEAAMAGFHINRLMVPGVDLVELILASQRRAPYQQRKFLNSDLGIPYTEGASGLDRAAIVAAQQEAKDHYGQPLLMAPSYGGRNFVTAGIDVASSRSLTIRISEILELPLDGQSLKRALFIGEIDSWEELLQLLLRYNVTLACIDSEPEGWMSAALTQRLPGRVLRVKYVDQQADVLKMGSNLLVTAARTSAIDATISLIRDRRNLLPQDLPDNYIAQLTAARRITEADSLGRKHARYRSTSPDDYLHAEVYDDIAGSFLAAAVEAGLIETDTDEDEGDGLEFGPPDWSE
jgi:hypothetical protein